ncbi:3-mercaptopyruvate sulfurtransferase [Bartonella sp. DGB1]|uniref:3-mercaptopyruvate sulfurtransferase n=1 Tax=Bartonella sp. DGB1 TaxID=3239807 RepID=UPI003525CF32
MILKKSPWILSSEWLAENLTDDKLKIIDASWYLPNQDVNAKLEYNKQHIPNAVFFDLDEICDKNSSLPHMVPPVELFETSVAKLGISTWDPIVIYDQHGYFSAPRVWWLFRIMGHRKAFILDGGFKAWQKNKLPVTNDVISPKLGSFKSNFHPDMVVSLSEMQKIVAEQKANIIDARSSARFNGLEPEPRSNLKSGHMPGAINLPYNIFTEDGFLKELPEISKIFKEKNINLDDPIVATCGSGVTAAMIIFALTSLGIENARLYDGSWAEWGAL